MVGEKEGQRHPMGGGAGVGLPWGWVWEVWGGGKAKGIRDGC